MSKDYIVLRSGKPVIRMYEEDEAKRVARNAAEREPGRTFEVVHIVDTYRRPRKI